MKILFTFTQAFNPYSGGVQRTTWKLGHFFTQQGYEVTYYSLKCEGHSQSYYGTLYHVPEDNGLFNVTNVMHLEATLRKIRPDVVINQMPYEKELREVLASNKEDLKYILLGCLRNTLFTFRSYARERLQQGFPLPVFKLIDNPLGIGIVQARHRWRHKQQLKAIIDDHDRFVLLAPPNRQELDYFVKQYKAHKVLSIPNSIPCVNHNALDNKEKVILYVGRLNQHQKRADLLIPFWEKVCQKLPDWKFIIVGNGPLKQNMEEDVNRKKLPSVVFKEGQNPEKFYQKSSIFVMPSANEGFPNVILEAQSYGVVPVAMNSYAALSWIVNDKKDTLLTKPFDTDMMAGQVLSLANDPEKLMLMQKAALNNAERFTIDKVGKMWVELFEELTQKHSIKG